MADQERDDDRPRLLVMQDEIRSSPGYRVRGLIDRVRRIGNLLQANVSEYRALVARLQDPSVSLSILSDEQPDGLERLLDEAERQLHNALAGMSARVNQQRAFLIDHFAEDNELLTAHAAKVDSEFKKDVASVFLKWLRNELEHHQLPVAQTRETYGLNSMSVTFILPTAPLLKWEWPKAVRAWISEQGDAVPIVEVVDTYARKAAMFDAWLIDTLLRKFARDMADFERMRLAFNREHAAVFGRSRT